MENASQALPNPDEANVVFLPQTSSSQLLQKRSLDKEPKRSTTATDRSMKSESRSTSVNNSRGEKATPRTVEEGALEGNQSPQQRHGHRTERGKDGKSKPPLKPTKRVNWGTESWPEEDEIYVYNILDNSVRPYVSGEDPGRSASTRHSRTVPIDADSLKREADLADWLRRKKEMKNSIRKGRCSNSSSLV